MTELRFPCAHALLAAWERPWSSRAIRYAYHALHRALARGCDVLEAARVDEHITSETRKLKRRT